MATDDENYPSDDAGTGQSLAITLEKGVALEFKPTGSGRQRYPIVARKKAIPALEAETILQELQEILVEVEDEVSTELDVEALNADVDA